MGSLRDPKSVAIAAAEEYAGSTGNGNQLPVRNAMWRHPVGENPGIVPGRFDAFRKDRSEGGGNTFMSPPHFDLSPGAALGVLRSRALSSG